MTGEIGWALGWFAVSLLVCLLAISISVRWALRPLSRSGDLPWYEKARLAQPARVTVAMSIVPGLLLSSMFGLMLSQQPEDSEGSWFAWAGFLGATAAIFLSAFRLTRRLRGTQITFGYWLAGVLSITILFFGSVIAFGVVLFTSPSEFGARTIGILLACAAGLLVLMWGGNLLLMRLVGLATPASGRLLDIVSAASAQAGMPPPPAWQLRWPAVNAFAFPLGRQVAVTDLAMEAMDDAQLHAICLHELAHLKEPRRIVILRALAAMMLLPMAAAIILMRTHGAWVLLVAVGLFLIVSRMVNAMSRRMELAADAQAKSDPAIDLSYARALECLYRENLTPLVGYSRGGTHPHGYDRLVAAGLQPDFPRPAAPRKLRALAGVLMVTAIILFIDLALIISLMLAGVIKDTREMAG